MEYLHITVVWLIFMMNRAFSIGAVQWSTGFVFVYRWTFVPFSDNWMIVLFSFLKNAGQTMALVFTFGPSDKDFGISVQNESSLPTV